MVDDYDVGGNHRKAYMLTVNSLQTANADDKDSDIFYIVAEIGKEIEETKVLSDELAEKIVETAKEFKKSRC